MKKYIQIIIIGIFFIILQSYFQDNLAFINIYEKYMGYLTPLIYAVFIAIFLDPIVEFFEKKFHTNRIIGIILTIILLMILIASFIGVIAPQIAKSIKELYSKMPMMQIKIEKYLMDITMYLKSKGILILGETKLQESAINFVKKNISSFQDFGLSALLNIVWWGVGISKFLIGAFLGILIIFNREYFIKFLQNILKITFGANKSHIIFDFLKSSRIILLKFIGGRIIVSAAVGLSTFLVMFISSTPYALLTGVMMGVGNMIPYIGSIVAGIIAIFLVSLAIPTKLIFLFLAILVAQIVDGWIVGPYVVGETVGMSAFWIMVAILIGGSMGGIVGMFFGVPIFAMIKLIYLKKLEKINNL